MEGKNPAEAEVHDNRREADQHRQIAFIECIKRGNQDLVRGIGDQADRITTQRRGRLFRGKGGEPAVFVDQADDGIGENDQAYRRWNRQKHDQPDSVRKSPAELTHIPQRHAARDQGKRHGRDRYAEDSERQLHEAKRDVEPTDRPSGGKRRRCCCQDVYRTRWPR